MIQKPCVNGIVAAVLSASVVPLHGALAREKSTRLLKALAKTAPRASGEAQSPAPTRPAPIQ
jgi:hypothetical protein